MLEKVSILLVGCGSMGSAMIRGWMTAGVGSKRFTVVTPHEASVMPLRAYGEIDWYPSPDLLPDNFNPDCIILAVKPQKMDAALADYKKFADKLFITVAAGKNLDTYRSILGENAKLVRMMPNLPAAYNKGMSVGFAGSHLDKDDLKLADGLFQVLGKLLWIENEGLFGIVTTVSGAGPAYLYLLTDALIQAGIEAGLDAQAAETLARQTMIGAGILLDHATESAGSLKKKVASPGGVTEAALNILEAPDKGLPDLMKNAVKAAVKRAEELAHA